MRQARLRLPDPDADAVLAPLPTRALRAWICLYDLEQIIEEDARRERLRAARMIIDQYLEEVRDGR